MIKKTKTKYQEYLNEIGIPEDNKKSNGGLIPDSAKYGDWLRKNDIIAFNSSYWDWCRSWDR